MDTPWLKQSKNEPLFPDLLWARPESKKQAGKLLIVGGNSYGLANVAKAYQEAQHAGVGSQRIFLPDSLRNQVPGKTLATIFAPSTPSGSFASSALAQLLEQAAWADAVLFAGDLGRNSETAILLEKFLSKFTGQITLVHDAADYITHTPLTVQGRDNTLLVLTMAQLQKLLRSARQPVAIGFDMNVTQLIEILRDFSNVWGVNLVIKLHQQLIVAAAGQASITSTDLNEEDYWRVPTAGHAAVWWLQNPQKTFEAITTSLVF